MDQNNYSFYSNSKALPIFQAITQTAYPVKYHDIIVEMLYDKFSTNSKIYLMNVANNINNSLAKIIVVKNILLISYKLKTDPIRLSILFYFMPFFPSVGPEVYLEKIGELVINEKLKNIIGKKNLRVNYENYIKWNGNANSIDDVLSWLKITFDNNFPVFHSKTPISYNGNCILNRSNLIEVSLFEEEPKKKELNPFLELLFNENDINKINQNIQKSNNRLSDNNNNNNTNYNNSNYNNNNNKDLTKKGENLLIDFSLFDIGKNSNIGYHEPNIKDTCEVLIREILYLLKPRINEMAFNILSKFEDLSLYKMKLNMIMNKKAEYDSKCDSILQAHQSLSLKLDNDITSTNKDVIKLKQIESFTLLPQIENLFLMTNERREMVMWIAKEKAIEENYNVLKRKFSKTKNNFESTVKLIRELTREQFTVKYKINQIAKTIHI